MAATALQATPAAVSRPLARASGSSQGGAHAHTERRGRRQRRRPLRVRSGVVHADTHVGLDAYAGGETTDASNPHDPRSPHSSSAHGTTAGAQVQQREHRGPSTGNEGGISSVSAETGEKTTKRALGKRVLNEIDENSREILMIDQRCRCIVSLTYNRIENDFNDRRVKYRVK